MKVLFLTNIPSPYRVDFFNELGKLCELVVAFERKDTYNRNYLWLSNEFDNFDSVFLKGYKTGADTAFCPSITKIIKDGNFDRIIIGGYSTPTGIWAIQYLTMKKIPFILNIDGGIIKTENILKHYVKKHFISSASMWLSTGRKSTEYLIHYGAKSENTYVYPFTSIKRSDLVDNIVSTAEKKILREKLSIIEENVILAAGQFIQRKGFDVLIKSASSLQKNTGVFIVGGEPTIEYLKIIQTLAIQNVHFIGFRSKLELREYFCASDVFVLPTREDIWGLVINEAMAYGLPIITTDKCIAGTELVKEGSNGFIVQTEKVDDLALKINRILKDRNLQNLMAKKSLETIEFYTIENMAKEIFMIISSKYVNLDKMK